MKYSLTCNTSNSSGAVRTLTEDELSGLIDGVTTSGSLFLLSGEEATVVCDLNDRYNISYFKYYYSGDGDISMSVSESQDVWSSVTHSAISGGVQAELTNYSPRWLKVNHNVTTGSGNMYELQVYNNDSNILFGPEGLYSVYGMDSSGSSYDEVSVYNPTNVVRDINVFVGEGVDTVADNLISVGLTSSGTFYSKREFGLYLPRDFSWDSGNHAGTINSGGYLTLSGTVTSGTYYSPVFSVSGYPNSRVFWDYSLGDGGYIDYRDVLDGAPCIGMRKYNYAPTGSWANGGFPDDDDPIWSTSSGSLSFVPVTNNSILDLRNNFYVQFLLSISGTHPSPPHLSKLGIEGALSVSDIAPQSYVDVYVSSVSGTVGDKTANLICWYRE